MQILKATPRFRRQVWPPAHQVGASACAGATEPESTRNLGKPTQGARPMLITRTRAQPSVRDLAERLPKQHFDTQSTSLGSVAYFVSANDLSTVLVRNPVDNSAKTGQIDDSAQTPLECLFFRQLRNIRPPQSSKTDLNAPQGIFDSHGYQALDSLVSWSSAAF